MSKAYYSEEQSFRQAWVWLIIIVATGAWLYSLTTVFIQDEMQKLTSYGIFVILIGIIPLAMIYMFFSMKLISKVDKKGIHYRFTILQRKFKSISPQDIASYEIRKYSALLEYGGYGIRIGRGKRGNAYNVGGNMGIQFVFSNGKKLLIGTRQPEAFKRAIDKLVNS